MQAMHRKHAGRAPPMPHEPNRQIKERPENARFSGRVKQGGFTSGRRGITGIPSFERDQPKPLVSKT